MKEKFKTSLGVFLAMADERRYEIFALVVFLICAAAIWQLLLIWTK